MYEESEQVSVPEDDGFPVRFYQLGSSSNEDGEGAQVMGVDGSRLGEERSRPGGAGHGDGRSETRREGQMERRRIV